LDRACRGKYWRGKFRLGGVQKEFSIGSYPVVSLAQARKEWDKARELIKAGKDPTAARRLARIASVTDAAVTFEAIAGELQEKKQREGKSDKTVTKVKWFQALTCPALGARPITEITPAEILAVLRPIEGRGHAETTKKLRGFIGQVFRFAIATSRVETDPTVALRGALAAPVVTHRAAINRPEGLRRPAPRRCRLRGHRRDANSA
jgi:integrase